MSFQVLSSYLGFAASASFLPGWRIPECKQRTECSIGGHAQTVRRDKRRWFCCVFSNASVGSIRSVFFAEVSWVPRLVAPSPKLPLVRVGTAAAGGNVRAELDIYLGVNSAVFRVDWLQTGGEFEEHFSALCMELTLLTWFQSIVHIKIVCPAAKF